MSLRSATQKVFDATLRLARAPITAARLAAMLMRYPLMTLQVVAAIHWLQKAGSRSKSRCAQ